MATSSHVEVLRRKHQALSEQVEMAQRSPATDGIHLRTLKKQKLQLKQQIARLDGQP